MDFIPGECLCTYRYDCVYMYMCKHIRAEAFSIRTDLDILVNGMHYINYPFI